MYVNTYLHISFHERTLAIYFWFSFPWSSNQIILHKYYLNYYYFYYFIMWYLHKLNWVMSTKHKEKDLMKVNWKVLRSNRASTSSPWRNETCQMFSFVVHYVQLSLVWAVPGIQKSKAQISAWNRLCENCNFPGSARWVLMDAAL